MSNHFNRHIDGIDIDFWLDLIESRGELVTLNKGEAVCRFGRRTNKMGYVKSGYLIYTIKGYKMIGGFTFPGALFGDYPNCLHNLPARFDIIAGRKTEVWMMDAIDLLSLYENDPYINRQGRQFAESAYNSLIERFCSFLTGAPKERYQSLIAQYPGLEQDVPQKEIAEYLQITPTHLSRIRKELLKQ
ncbi:MAG: cyclic nucleotide-binding domain-containing protein [Muribaculaceae bacterium]|nr:cyclic nucleotide-binding domain-containing protein [Muribaculaceae bacterium]